jgi:hypothetical protein
MVGWDNEGENATPPSGAEKPNYYKLYLTGGIVHSGARTLIAEGVHSEEGRRV